MPWDTFQRTRLHETKSCRKSAGCHQNGESPLLRKKKLYPRKQHKPALHQIGILRHIVLLQKRDRNSAQFGEEARQAPVVRTGGLSRGPSPAVRSDNGGSRFEETRMPMFRVISDDQVV